MIQEPARKQNTGTDTCTETSTTIPIVLCTEPHPRILLIKVPKRESSNREEQTVPRTRLIRIPFLPGPVSTTSSVKQAQASAFSSESTTSYSSSSPHFATPTTTNLKESNNSYQTTSQLETQSPAQMVLETVQVSNTQMTLASMTGIELTGADMALPMSSLQDMSGAMPMPTTATVEEIDVPGFIDEFLKDISSTINMDYENEPDTNENEELNYNSMSYLSQSDNSTNNVNSGYNDGTGCLFDNDFIQLSEQLEDDLNDTVQNNCIDFHAPNNDDMVNYLASSSTNPMFSSSSNYNFNTMIWNEVPQVLSPPLSDNNDSHYGFSQESLGYGQLAFEECTQQLHVTSHTKQNPSSRNLHLDIKKDFSQTQNFVETPQAIDYILDMQEEDINRKRSNESKLIEEDIKHEIIIDTISEGIDISAANTPGSSIYACTNEPPSPACSYASTSNISAATLSPASSNNTNSKRKRGRPAKETSDGPDPKKLAKMSEEEAKNYTDRLKNNEASRISRQKTKKREQEEIDLEMKLQKENALLIARKSILDADIKKLREALKNRYDQNRIQ